jgi:hypothetical protein
VTNARVIIMIMMIVVSMLINGSWSAVMRSHALSFAL